MKFHSDLKLVKKAKWAGTQQELDDHIASRDCKILNAKEAYT